MSASTSETPGCPLCHRADAVEPMGPGAEPIRKQGQRGYGYVWSAPNFLCTFCVLPFRYEPAEGRYRPFRMRNHDGVVHRHEFEPPLGPGDAPRARSRAAERIGRARRADAGDSPFEVFGSLKRAGTWMMKGALAQRGAAPHPTSRYDEALLLLCSHLSWDAYTLMSDFGVRTTALLYGDAIGEPTWGALQPRRKALSAAELREHATTHLAEAEALLAYLRDGGPLPAGAARTVRALGVRPRPEPPPPAPEPSPSRVAPVDASAALDRSAELLGERVVRLDFAVDARVVCAAWPDEQRWRGPLVGLRVPLNGLWWDEHASLAEEGGEHESGAFGDVVVRWGTETHPPPVGVWVHVFPDDARSAVEALPAETPEALARWLRELPDERSRDVPSDESRRLSYRTVAPPPLRPRVEMVRFHDGGEDGSGDAPGTDAVWPVFPDDPLLAAFFDHPGGFVGGGPSDGTPEARPEASRRGLLYQCSCGDPDCGSLEARAWSDPEQGTVVWADVTFVRGGERRHLGSAVAFDAAHYARSAAHPDRSEHRRGG